MQRAAWIVCPHGDLVDGPSNLLVAESETVRQCEGQFLPTYDVVDLSTIPAALRFNKGGFAVDVESADRGERVVAVVFCDASKQPVYGLGIDCNRVFRSRVPSEAQRL